MDQVMGKKGWRAAALLALVALLAAGCAPKTDVTAASVSENRPVKVAKAVKMSMGDPKEQIADIFASSQVDLVPKADGQVLEVLKHKGDTVHEGDVIFRIDTKDVQVQKEKSEVALQGAEESLQKAREDLQNNRTDLQNSIAKAQQQLDSVTKDYNKMRNDYDAGLVTKRQVEQAENTVNSARMDLQGLQNKLAALDSPSTLSAAETQVNSSRLALQDVNNTLANYEVKAPISGVLTDLAADVGMTVSRTGKIGQIQQTGSVKLKADLTESAVKLIGSKQELVYYTTDNPSLKSKAKITYLASAMNSQTKLYALELEAPNDDGLLKSGGRAMVQLTTEDEEMSVAVPSLSIVREGADAFVFVVKGDGTVEKRKIKTGRIKDANQEVLEGLQPGEQIVVSGQHQLKDGQKVEVSKDAAK
ncbi:efflux RND transporter periplasmic adaptor subunit [Paenibacillus hamazuiensis]|uniref:efflux RND transporter periplasmic adaptor subunit n=1 Tax=Paenibacillus hamazuiensis TaxID=2936508 RepID=UPI00200DE5DF|nr:efflux RND transporter periplasmic adaptor subunit [Paenibacillus hamazuiensis]